jgi:capsular exopolysaccharide synthesis family protein
MTDATASPSPALADYLAILGRRKWLFLQAIILTPVAALILSLSQPAKYEATARVLISQQDIAAAVTGIQTTPNTIDPVRFINTQAQLARVPEVADRAVRVAGVRNLSGGDLLSSSDVEPSGNADVLNFLVSNHVPLLAQRLADAYARAFTEYRKQLDTAKIEDARAQLLQRLQQLRQSGQEKTDLYSGIVRSEQQLRTQELLETSNSVVSPSRGASQTAPNPRRNALLALILGCLLGVSMAFLWEALDRRVRSTGEIEEALARPVLARLGPPPKRYRHGLAMIDDPRAPPAETFRRLRANIEFANLDRAARTIMITSAVPQEGKSTTAANLAIAFAEARMKVILVDFDLRKPSLGTLLEYQSRPGVAEVVRGQATLEEALLPVGITSGTDQTSAAANGATQPDFALRVLPAGLVLPLDPSQLIQSTAFDRVLKQLAEHADVVLFDAPPLLAVAETTRLSMKVDAMIAVTRVGVVPRAALSDLGRLLEMSPTPTLGIVITGVSDVAAAVYGPYGYGDTGARKEHRRVLIPRHARTS